MRVWELLAKGATKVKASDKIVVSHKGKERRVKNIYASKGKVVIVTED